MTVVRSASVVLACAVSLAAPALALTNIKAVQRGTTSITNPALTATVTLGTTVDATKSFLVFGVRTTSNTLASNPSSYSVRGNINAAGTTLTFTRADTTVAGTVTIEWQVAEFTVGVTVQRGALNIPTGAPAQRNVTLATAVNLARAVPIVSTAGNLTTFDGDDHPTASLTSTTNLQFERAATDNPCPVEWQVVEFADATVQTGTLTLAATAAGVSATVTVTAVNTARAWLLYSHRGVDAGTGDPISNQSIRGQLTNATTLTFDRYTREGAQTIRWYLVEFTDTTFVPHGSTTITGANTTPAAQPTFSPFVTPACSIVTLGGENQESGRADTTTNNMGMAKATMSLSSSTGITVTRSATSAGGTGNADFPWSVVAFPGPSCPNGLTAARVDTIEAEADSGGTTLFWRTGYEADNLGFHLHREDADGSRVRVDDDLIAGSALVASPGQELSAGRSYSYRVPPAAARGAARFWLEEISLDGTSTWHGPIQAATPRPDRPKARAAAPMTALASSRKFQPVPRPQADTLPVDRPAPGDREVSWRLAASAAVKIGIRSEGWYTVSRAQLLSAGLSATADGRRLALTSGGQPVPVQIDREENGEPGSFANVSFYATGVDTEKTDTRIYWLVEGLDRTNLQADLGAPGPVNGSTSYPAVVERADRNLYFSSLTNGDATNFFGPVIYRAGATLELPVEARDASSATPPALDVSIQGVTAGHHRVIAFLNDRRVGEVVFSDRDLASATFPLDPAAVLNGVNLVKLVPNEGPADVSLVDAVRLDYPRLFRATGETFSFTAPGRTRTTISGFAGPDVRVLDVTEAGKAMELVVTKRDGGGAPAWAVVPPRGGDRRLFAFSKAGASKPAFLTPNRPSAWHADDGADLVILSHASFLPSVERLAAHRRSQGLSVAVVDLEDVYDEFGDGAPDPGAIRRFVAHALEAWSVKPRFLLLAGGASYDARGRVTTPGQDLVPTRLLDGSNIETASDDWFADTDDDGFAEIPVGRLPVRNVVEADRIVDKLIRYDTQPAAGRRAVLVSDRKDVYDFDGAADRLSAAIPGDVSKIRIPIGTLGAAEAHRQVVSELDRGASVLHFFGHGSIDFWRENVLTAQDAVALDRESALSVVVGMTCLNGYFIEPRLRSLAEALLVQAPGGAIAVWTSATYTDASLQAPMSLEAGRRLLEEGSTATIGEVFAAAKLATGSGEIRKTWNLLGDPSMRLR